MNKDEFRRSAGLSAQLAEKWFAPLQAAMKEFSISTPLQQAHFIGQLGHESKGFSRISENLNYSVSGLTRFDYLACGRGIGLDMVAEPDLLLSEAAAARSAGWFWKTHGCNALAEACDVRIMTKRINVGDNGHQERTALIQTARSILCSKPAV